MPIFNRDNFRDNQSRMSVNREAIKTDRSYSQRYIDTYQSAWDNKLFSGARELTGDILRAMPRAWYGFTKQGIEISEMEKAGLPIRDPKTRKLTPETVETLRGETPFTPETKFEKFLLGEDPVLNPYESDRQFVETVGTILGKEGDELKAFVEKNNTGTFLTALDTLPIVGGFSKTTGTNITKKIADNFATELVHIDNPKLITRGLESWKVDSQVAETVAKSIADSKNANQISDILVKTFETSDSIQRLSREAVTDLVPKLTASDPDDVAKTVSNYLKKQGLTGGRKTVSQISDADIFDTIGKIQRAVVKGDEFIEGAVREAVTDLNKIRTDNVLKDFVNNADEAVQGTKVMDSAVDEVDELAEVRTTEVPENSLKVDKQMEDYLRNSGDEAIEGIANELDVLKLEREVVTDTIKGSNGAQLIKYTSKKAAVTPKGNMGLPEAGVGKKGRFAERGDEILDEMGLTPEEAEKAIDDYTDSIERLYKLNSDIAAKTQELRDVKKLKNVTDKQVVAGAVTRTTTKMQTEVNKIVDEIERGFSDMELPDDFMLTPGVVDPKSIKAYKLYETAFQKGLGGLLTWFEESAHATKRFMQLNKDNLNMRGVDDLYQKTTAFYGRKSARVENVERWSNDIVNSVEAAAKKHNLNPEELHKHIHDYLVTSHVPERNAKLGAGAAGMADDTALLTKELIEGLPYYDDIKQISDNVMDFHRQTLDLIYDGDLIDETTFRILRSTYKNHVPLNRIMDEDNIVESLSSVGLNPKGTGIYKAKGSNREVADVIENIIQARVQAIGRTEQNLVQKNLYKFAIQNQDLGIFKELNLKQYLALDSRKQSAQVAELYLNGTKKYLYIDDLDLAPAFIGNNRKYIQGTVNPFSPDFNPLVGMKLVTNTLSRLVTKYNINFGVPNNIRDTQEAAVWLMSQGEQSVSNKMISKQFTGQGHIAVTDWLRGKDSELSRIYEDLRLQGGTSGGANLVSRDEIARSIKDVKINYRSKPRKAAEKALNLVENYNRILEDSTRVNVYKAALDAGKSKKEAAFLAKKATVDFDQMGTASPIFNSLYMFAKVASVSGVKALRSLKDPKTLMKTTAVIGAGVTSVNKMNDILYPDWRNLVSDYDRQSSLPIVIPQEDGKPLIIKIPVAYALRPLKVVADQGYDAATGNQKSIKDFGAKMLTASMQSFNPLGGDNLLSAFMPTFLDVPSEIASNKSWSGRTIYPDYAANKSNHLRYYPSMRDTASGRTYIRFTNWLDSTTGISISPASLDYAVDQYTGGPGKTTKQIVDSMKSLLNGEEPEIRSIPIMSSFFKKVEPGEYISASEVYQFASVIKRTRADYNHVRDERAEDVYAQLSVLPPEEARIKFDALRVNDPTLAKDVSQIYQDEKLGITAEDRMIRGLGISSGDRARVLYSKFYNVDNKVKTELWGDYVKKGIITKDVAKQLKYLFDKDIQPSELLRKVEADLAKENDIKANTSLDIEDSDVVGVAGAGTIAASKKLNKGLSKKGVIIGGAALAIFGAKEGLEKIQEMAKNSVVEFTNEPPEPKEPEVPKVVSDEEKEANSHILETIAHNESSIIPAEEDKYTFRKPSGDASMGDDIGKYQVVEAEILAWSDDFLGRTVTPDEFHQSPELQEEYMNAKVKALLEEGLTMEEILAVHRDGLTGYGDPEVVARKLTKRDDYVTNGMAWYREQQSRS